MNHNQINEPSFLWVWTLVETDAELAEDTVRAWNLEDMDFNALTKAFADLRMRLAA